MKWDLSLPSSVVSTVLVLVVDVIALWLLDGALFRVAAYLNAGEVYDAHNSVKISDVWFECVSGRSHGPVWFRKTQVAVKLGMLVCSITVGMSIDGINQEQKVALPQQTVLVRRNRRMADIGIGGLNNFSRDVQFVLIAEKCSSADGNDSLGIQTTYWNARSLQPFEANEFGKEMSIECLSEKNGFSTQLVQIREDRFESAQYCPFFMLAPLKNRSTGKLDNDRILMTDCPQPKVACKVDEHRLKWCPWRLTHSHCQNSHRGGCAATLELGNDQVLILYMGGGGGEYSYRRGKYQWIRKRDAETVKMMAMYLDAGITNSPIYLDIISSFQSDKRNIEQIKGTIGSRINVTPFLAGFLLLWAIVSGFVVTAVASHFIMMRKKRSEYALGLRVAEVARFARRKVGDIQGQSLFVKLHLDVPHLTVSGVAENSGTWSVEEVLAAKAAPDDDYKQCSC